MFFTSISTRRNTPKSGAIYFHPFVRYGVLHLFENPKQLRSKPMMTTKQIIKTAAFTIVTISVSLIIVFLVILSNFNLLGDIEYTLLSRKSTPNYSCNINVYNVEGGATVNNAIQIRQVCNQEEKVLITISGYNTLNDISFKDSSTAVIKISKKNHYDTLIVINLNDQAQN